MTDWKALAEERRAKEAAERELAMTKTSMWEPSYGFCEFNETDRVALAMTLEAIRRRICAYGGGNRCDCKYGLMPDIYAVANEFGLSRGENSPPRNILTSNDCYRGVKDGNHEQTGCPELRELIHRLLHRDVPLI